MPILRKDGICMITDLCGILPIFAAVIHQDQGFIFGDIVRDITCLSQRIADDLLDSDAEIAVVHHHAIIDFAAEVGSYYTMCRALYLLGRVEDAATKEYIARSLMSYKPIEKLWLPLLLNGLIEPLSQKPENQHITGLLLEAYRKIAETAFGDDVW